MIESIREDLAAVGIDIASADLRPFAETNNSCLFRLTCQNFPHDLILKYPRASSLAEAEKRVRDEYTALSKAFGNSDETPLCPRPYDMLLARGGLAIEYIAAPSLRDRLFEGHIDVAEKLDLMRQTGACLRAYHDRFAKADEPVHAGDQLAWVAAASASSPSWSAADRHLALLRGTSVLVNEARLPVSVRHGDCKPDNFLCAATGMLTVDILMSHSTYRVADIAYFLNSFLMAAFKPAGLRMLRIHEQVEAAFLEGYDYPAEMDKIDHLNWFRLRSMLLIWSEYPEERFVKRLYLRFINRRIYAILRRRLAQARAD